MIIFFLFCNDIFLVGRIGAIFIPGQTETGVRFVAATHTPDGIPLETPGIVHEKEVVEIDFQNVELDDKYKWDTEHALNVWVCPIKNTDGIVNEYSILGGLSFLPYFDADEMLEGCNELSQSITYTGIFLNSQIMLAANNVVTFAHEAGHFLALEHVFAPGDDFCDDTPWYDFETHWAETQEDIEFKRTGGTGEVFWSDNIMDYDYGFMTGFTHDQVERIRYTLQYAYFIPGKAGKVISTARSNKQPHRFGDKPIL